LLGLKEALQSGLHPGIEILKALSAVTDHRTAEGLTHGFRDFHGARDKQFDMRHD